MVFKSIERIKVALPEITDIIMFYNNGIIFQTTFKQEINIPKLGEHMAESLNQLRKVYEICNFESKDYIKLIFETEDISVIILKLGEDSNIALFFKNEDSKELKIRSIQRYLTKIEELIDMDAKELILQDIISEENEIKELKKTLDLKKKELENIKVDFEKNLNIESKDDLKISYDKACESLEKECNHLDQEITNRKKRIDILKNKIEEQP